MKNFSSSSSAQWETMLREHGLRNTLPLRTVLEVISDSKKALSPSDIFRQARTQTKGIGLATIYRALSRLEELGLINRVHHPNRCDLFLRAAKGHEHILICTACRETEYFQGDNLSRLEQELSRQSGYVIHNHWLQFNGLCAKCRKISPVKDGQ